LNLCGEGFVAMLRDLGQGFVDVPIPGDARATQQDVDASCSMNRLRFVDAA
jgi:hypothetical protein